MAFTWKMGIWEAKIKSMKDLREMANGDTA